MEHYGTLPERWNPYQYCKKGLAFLVPEKCGTPPSPKTIIDMEKSIDVSAVERQYRDYLYQLGYSRDKQQGICSQIGVFLNYVQVRDIGEVSQQQVKEFYGFLQVWPGKGKSKAGLTGSTIALYISALQHFFRWLEITEQIDTNPISGIKFKGYKKNRREPLSVQQVQALFAAAKDNMMELALLHLCYSCGMRRGEVERLDVRDVHFKQRLLYVREGKGCKRRVVPLTARVAGELENYCVHVRAALQRCGGVDDIAFMVNRQGRRLGGSGCTDMFNRIKERASDGGVSLPGISLHHLRHSIATHLVQGGMGMMYVKDFLGHSSLDTTQIYAKASMAQLKRQQHG